MLLRAKRATADLFNKFVEGSHKMNCNRAKNDVHAVYADSSERTKAKEDMQQGFSMFRSSILHIYGQQWNHRHCATV